MGLQKPLKLLFLTNFMKLSEIKFEYYIDSSLDLEELLELFKKRDDSKTEILKYYEGDSHKEITKVLPIGKLKDELLEAYNEEKWPSARFENFELLIDEESITINSKIKLDLSKFEAVEKIK